MSSLIDCALGALLYLSLCIHAHQGLWIACSTASLFTEALRRLSNEGLCSFYTRHWWVVIAAAHLVCVEGLRVAFWWLLFLTFLAGYRVIKLDSLSRGLVYLAGGSVAVRLLGCSLRCFMHVCGFYPKTIIVRFVAKVPRYLGTLIHVPAMIKAVLFLRGKKGKTNDVPAHELSSETGSKPTSKPASGGHGYMCVDPFDMITRRQRYASRSYDPAVLRRIEDLPSSPPAVAPVERDPTPGVSFKMVKTKSGGTRCRKFIDAGVQGTPLPQRLYKDAVLGLDQAMEKGKRLSEGQAPSQPEPLIRKPLPPVGEPEQSDFALEAEVPQPFVLVVEDDVRAADRGDTAGPPDRDEPELEDGVEEEGTPVSDSAIETAGISATEVVVVEDGVVEEGTPVPSSPVQASTPRATPDDAETRPAVINLVCSDLQVESSIQVPERFLLYRNCGDAAEAEDRDSLTDGGLVVSPELLEYEVSSSHDPVFALAMDSLADAFSGAFFAEDSGLPEGAAGDVSVRG
jgi:hypothetical protein